MGESKTMAEILNCELVCVFMLCPINCWPAITVMKVPSLYLLTSMTVIAGPQNADSMAEQ